MAFPGPKVHRVSRRKVGRGQTAVSATGTVVSVTPTGSNLLIEYSIPVVVRGPIGIAVATRTIVSQTALGGTAVAIVLSGAATGLAWSIPANSPNVSTYTGGKIAGASGTFP